MFRNLLASIAAGTLVTAALGQSCQEAAKVGSCDKSAAVPACCSGQNSALAKARATVPAVKFQVGEKTTCCPDEAKELAKGDAKAIKFVVGEKKFDDRSAANEELARALDAFMNDSMNVKYAVGSECVACPMEAGSLAKKNGEKVQYRVAAFNFADESAATKAISAAKEAAGKVEMKMMVGDKCFECPASAGDAAKSAGKSVEYVIGEKRTCCPVEGKVELAKARIDAAFEVLAKSAQS